MSWRGLIVVVAVGLVAAACSDSTESSPATAPPTVAPPSTTATSTTDAPSTTTAPSTAPPTTVDRIAEIEAIFKDLEFRRLDALYRDDEEAYRSVHSSAGYLEQGLNLEFGRQEFLAAPTLDLVDVTVTSVLADADGCVAAELRLDLGSLLGPDAVGSVVKVATQQGEEYGLAFAGDGWTCAGPHPLDE